MRAQRLLSCLLVFGVLAAFSSAYAQGLSVKRLAKKDAIFKYEMNATVDVLGISTQAVIKAVSSEKITNVAEDGSYSIEETQLSASMTINNQTRDDVKAETLTTTFSPDGRVVTVEGSSDAVNSRRIANMGVIIDPGKPLAVGEKWVAEIKEDAAKNVIGVQASYEILAEEKVGDVDTIKVKASLKESTGSAPLSCEATYWIDKADGSRVKSESVWKGFPSPGGIYNATISYARVP